MDANISVNESRNELDGSPACWEPGGGLDGGRPAGGLALETGSGSASRLPS